MFPLLEYFHGKRFQGDRLRDGIVCHPQADQQFSFKPSSQVTLVRKICIAFFPLFLSLGWLTFLPHLVLRVTSGRAWSLSTTSSTSGPGSIMLRYSLALTPTDQCCKWQSGGRQWNLCRGARFYVAESLSRKEFGGAAGKDKRGRRMGGAYIQESAK
jgi:hypothetical protein